MGLLLYCMPAERLAGTPREAEDVVVGAVAAPGFGAPLTRCRVWPFYAESAPTRETRRQRTCIL